MSRRSFALPLLLTVVAAATDAISYLGLGRVFPANMTGNTVLLGIGIATGDGEHVAHSGIALAGFVTGAALSGARPHRGSRWVRGPGPDTACELVLVAAALGWWQAGRPPQLALIAMLGVAMGIQSAAMRRLAVGVTATYITGTWTAVSEWDARLVGGRRPERPRDHRLQAAVVVTYFAFGLLAAAVFTDFSSWALVIPALALCLAVPMCGARE
jgi:uncharacterized membrane protein YoaK (UPF0700 family)